MGCVNKFFKNNIIKGKCMKKILVLLIIAFNISIAEPFEVVDLTGIVILNDSITLKKGDIFTEKDFLFINQKSDITIKNSKNKKLVIKSSGKYSGGKIKSKLRLSSIDVNSNLANKLLNDLSESEDMLSVADLTFNMSKLGAVERSFYNNNNDIPIIPRDSYVVDYVDFIWMDNGSELYTFTIYNSTGVGIYSITTSNTYINLNVIKLLTNREECYYWNVLSKNGVSPDYCLYLYSDADIQKIKQEENKLISQLNLTDAIDNLILAKFYETYRLNYEANKYFQMCVVMDSSIDENLMMYYNFLESIGVKHMPIYIFNY